MKDFKNNKVREAFKRVGEERIKEKRVWREELQRTTKKEEEERKVKWWKEPGWVELLHAVGTKYDIGGSSRTTSVCPSSPSLKYSVGYASISALVN